MSRGARATCRCGTKLKMKAAWICEPCALVEWAEEIAAQRARREAWQAGRPAVVRRAP